MPVKGVALAALVLVPACGGFFESRTLLLVTASGDAPRSTTVGLTVGAESFLYNGPLPATGEGEIRRGFYLPRDTPGTTTVSALAFDVNGCLLARDSRKVTLDRGDSNYVALVLKRSSDCEPEAPRDAGGPDARVPDAGVAADAAAADAAGPDLPAREAAPPDAGLASSCRLWAHTQCVKFAECLPVALAQSLGSLGACEARLELACVRDLVELPGSRLTPAALQACAEAFAAPGYSCAQLRSFVSPAACLLLGERPEGAACGVDHQCRSGRCSAMPGTCGQCLPAVKLGDPCQRDSDCEQPLEGYHLCWNFCVRAGGLNAPCDAVIPLDRPPRLCDGNHHCVGGACAPLGRLDAPCTNDLQCDDGFRCLGQTASRCRPIVVIPDGQPCSDSDVCAGSGFCGPQDVCVGGVIEPQACHGLVGPYCLPPAECKESRCELPPRPIPCGM